MPHKRPTPRPRGADQRNLGDGRDERDGRAMAPGDRSIMPARGSRLPRRAPRKECNIRSGYITLPSRELREAIAQHGTFLSSAVRRSWRAAHVPTLIAIGIGVILIGGPRQPRG
jgi:hypothetical protein